MVVNRESSVTTENKEFGDRLSQVIQYLLLNEESVKVQLARRLDIPLQTLLVWERGGQKSIRKGYNKLAATMRCHESSMENFLLGRISFEQLIDERENDERENDSPLTRILREVEKLSDKEQLQLNWVLANRLLKKQTLAVDAPLFSPEPPKPREYIEFSWGDRRRLKRYIEEVKKTNGWDTEGFIAAVVEHGAKAENVRSVHGDALTEEPNRVYNKEELEVFLPILPCILKWSGDRPILDSESRWNSIDSLIQSIKKLERSEKPCYCDAGTKRQPNKRPH